MVFTIAGLLASIVIIQVGGVRSRAYLTALRSDLRNFAVAQESYYYDFDIYTADTTQLAGRGFQTSAGASIVVNEATVGVAFSPDGTELATASHDGTSELCYMFIPGASPLGSAVNPGVVSCG